MSALLRPAGERNANDFYPTPAVAIKPLLDELEKYVPSSPVILDPGCGQGALTLACLERWPTAIPFAVDLYDPPKDINGWPVHWADFLTMEPRAVDLIISNPPFSMAREFIDQMHLWRDERTVMAVLQRMNYMGSQKRHEWWRSMARPKLRVLSTRPSFTEGGTDSTEYCWYLWGLPESAPALEWYR